MMHRILAVWHARNLEFIRDRSALGWTIFMPLALVFGLAVIFSGEGADEFQVAVLVDEARAPEAIERLAHPFLDTRFIEFIPTSDREESLNKVARHQLDLLIELRETPRYWMNEDSPKGYIAERLLLQADPSAQKQVVTGKAVRYVDWLVPGILGMNMMFSSLFGVGYVVVRYRKNGFLKRLRATPLNALEFIIAQVLSRIALILATTSFVFVSVKYFLDITMEGSYLLLALVALFGGSALISLALLIAARVSSEEFAGGLLNMISWPMMLLSGVFFSLEGSSEWLQSAAKLLPLTQLLDAARLVMIDGAGIAEIWPQLAALVAMTVVFLTLGASLFKWRFG
jgi:ABC-type multidrug transport system permease subunit